MAVTLKDVAARAGVSRSAVSRTFTDGASVSPRMREKVEAAAKELGYRPNRLASSLTTGRTQLIGLVSNNFQNPIFLEVFDLFTRGLQARGLRPLLVNLSADIDPESSVEMLREYSVDGVVVASSTLSPEFAQAFADAGMPVVHAFGRKSDAPRTHVVGIDNVACGAMAARALLAAGYGHVHMLAGPAEATSTQDRLQGFQGVMAAQKDILSSHSFASAYSFDAGRLEMQRLLAAGPPAQGYFCGDDVLSMGALSALADAGHAVPGDVGLLGLNDMAMARWESFALSTIHQPIPEIVEACMDVMEEMLKGPLWDRPSVSPKCHVFECSLTYRKTLPAPA
ncbi:LacI family DNA-binding transcriptional regulator [Primorskyibacter sp. S187A]|uniref:LacI family DNA-binding transcriptional regulator n=1 Tax=Primorskyibacter sp. S187A TaxID=3415130 RepID=UPI003C7C2203